MLNQESEEYTRELQALEETPEMRRDRLKSRARELIRRREQEKRDFANLMRERQVREASIAWRTGRLLACCICGQLCVRSTESCTADAMQRNEH